jgi:uncharacterized protein VirK/YbjX
MLARRKTSSDFPLARLNDKAHAWLSAACHPIYTWRWLQFLKRRPLLQDILPSPLPYLLRIHRPYLSRRLTCQERLALLIAHYEQVQQAGFAQLIQLAAHAPMALSRFAGKSGRQYELLLSACDPARRDGELVLQLMSGETCVYSAAFVMGGDAAERHLMLGGLQGMLATDRHFGIKQITRDLYGCRPKDLMVAMVCEIGSSLGCTRTVLIGNDNKLPEARRHYCRKSADYDRSWREMQAHRRDDGNFELPCPAHPPAAEYDDRVSQPEQERRAGMPARAFLMDAIRCSVHSQVDAVRSAPFRPFSTARTPAEPARRPEDNSESEDLSDAHDRFTRLQRSL